MAASEKKVPMSQKALATGFLRVTMARAEPPAQAAKTKKRIWIAITPVRTCESAKVRTDVPRSRTISGDSPPMQSSSSRHQSTLPGLERRREYPRTLALRTLAPRRSRSFPGRVGRVPQQGDRVLLLHQPLQVVHELAAAVLRVLVVVAHVDGLHRAHLL